MVANNNVVTALASSSSFLRDSVSEATAVQGVFDSHLKPFKE